MLYKIMLATAIISLPMMGLLQSSTPASAQATNILTWPEQTSPTARSQAKKRAGLKWCARYRAGASNCGFYTLKQCRAAVSGVGGSCVRNRTR